MSLSSFVKNACSWLWILCLPIAIWALLKSIEYLYMIDFSMLSVVIVCTMPGLCLIDVVTMLVLAWACVHGLDKENSEVCAARRRRISYAGFLLVWHLVSAALSCVLLVIPAHSIWAEGVTLYTLRFFELVLAASGFLMGLGLVRVLVTTLLSMTKDKEKAEDGKQFSFEIK